MAPTLVRLRLAAARLFEGTPKVQRGEGSHHTVLLAPTTDPGDGPE